MPVGSPPYIGDVLPGMPGEPPMGRPGISPVPRGPPEPGTPVPPLLCARMGIAANDNASAQKTMRCHAGKVNDRRKFATAAGGLNMGHLPRRKSHEPLWRSRSLASILARFSAVSREFEITWHSQEDGSLFKRHAGPVLAAGRFGHRGVIQGTRNCIGYSRSLQKIVSY